MDIFKVIGIGLTGVFCAVLLKRENGEFAFLVSTATALVIVLLILPTISDIFGLFEQLSSSAGVASPLIKTVVKIIGIGYVVEFAAGLADDAKESAIARNILLAGKLAILLSALPIIKAVFGVLGELLK